MSKKIAFPIELKSEYEISEFRNECENPRFVAKCLAEHNRWRRGQDEYGLGEENPEDLRQMPLGPQALGIVIESAVEHLNLYANDQEKCS